jgi:hypothetical protein
VHASAELGLRTGSLVRAGRAGTPSLRAPASTTRTPPRIAACRRATEGTHAARRSAQAHHVLTAGGTRQLGPTKRLRGRFNTDGIVSLALELSNDSSSVTLCTELAQGARPRFGATLNLSH